MRSWMYVSRQSFTVRHIRLRLLRVCTSFHGFNILSFTTSPTFIFVSSSNFFYLFLDDFHTLKGTMTNHVRGNSEDVICVPAIHTITTPLYATMSSTTQIFQLSPRQLLLLFLFFSLPLSRIFQTTRRTTMMMMVSKQEAQ